MANKLCAEDFRKSSDRFQATPKSANAVVWFGITFRYQPYHELFIFIFFTDKVSQKYLQLYFLSLEVPFGVPHKV